MTHHQLTLSQVGLLVVYALAMSLGQLLFKAAAQFGSPGSSVAQTISAVAGNGYFVAAILLYTGLAVLWVWILTFTPLSYAYPFAALAFAVTPLLAAAIFSDPVSVRLLLGCFLIVAGIIVVAS